MKELRRVVLIDDDETCSFITDLILKQLYQKVEIKSFLNGELAFNYFSNGITEIPDLIFLDVNMPKMNGLEFLENMENLDIEGLKIIMYSSSSRPEEVTTISSYKNVIGYIEKPVNIESLTNLMDELKYKV